MGLGSVFEKWSNGIRSLSDYFFGKLINHFIDAEEDLIKIQKVNDGKFTNYKCPVCGDLLVLNHKKDGVIYYTCHHCFKEFKNNRHMVFIGVLNK